MALLLLSTAQAERFEPRPHTVLIYENQAGEQQSRFIVRVARYAPDIVLEWETQSDQGTVHLFRSAVEEGPGFTLSGLFEVGVDNPSSDMMTLWLPRRTFRQLGEKKSAKIKLNRLPLKLRQEGEEDFHFTYNQESLNITVLVLADNRGGRWLVAKDPENPLLVGYESRYFKQRLKSVSATSRQTLRWIKKLPPIR